MGIVANLKTPNKHSEWRHRLWLCKNYWDKSRRYKCTGCGKTLRCYWAGNDITGHGIDYCNRCAKRLAPTSEGK